MITEKEQKNREELFKLMQENPELPVVPMVDGEIPGDDCGRWLGAWGSAYIDEYLLTRNSERILFKSDDDICGVIESYLTDDEYETLPPSEEAFQQTYDALPWTKAIIVNIDPPD